MTTPEIIAVAILTGLLVGVLSGVIGWAIGYDAGLCLARRRAEERCWQAHPVRVPRTLAEAGYTPEDLDAVYARYEAEHATTNGDGHA